MKRDAWDLMIVAAAALLVLLGTYRLTPVQDEQVIIPVKDPEASVVLTAGQTARQRLVLAPGTYSGVTLYSTADRLSGQPLSVAISSREGVELARSQYARATYLPTDDELLRLEFSTPRWQLAEPQHVYVDVTVRSGNVPLRVWGPPADLYRFGELEVDGEEAVYDLALSLLVPKPLPFGARQGAIAGVAALFGLTLIVYFVPQRWQWTAAAALVMLLAPLALAGYWFSVDRLGIADWDYYFSLHHYYRHSLLNLHTFPFWNPYTCGGTAGLADPEFPGFTLTFLLELIFGIPRGLRLAIYLSVVIGAWGMLALGKRLRLSPPAALLSALAVTFGTVNLLEITEGHVNIFAAMWLPWIFWAWLGAYRGWPHGGSLPIRGRLRLSQPDWSESLAIPSDRQSFRRTARQQIPALLCGVFLALTFLQGGIYLLMYTGLAFAALFFLVPRPWRAARVTVTAGAWALGLVAVKLVPVLLWLRQFPDQAYAGSAYTLPYLTEILFGRHVHGSYVIPGQTSGWHEYGAYIGYIVFALALIGVSQWRRGRLILALVVGVLAAGGLSTLGPQLEPLFDHLWFFPRSSISRIILMGIIPLALLSGLGLDVLQRRLPARGRWLSSRLVMTLLVGFAAIDIFSLSYQLSEQAFVLPEVYPVVPEVQPPISYTPLRYDAAGEGSRTTRTYSAARAGWGTFAYCSVLGPQAHVRTVFDEGGSALLSAPHDRITYEVLRWSPNAVEARVTAPAPTDVTLNTNYAEGWLVNGQPTKDVGGLVATRVGAGTQTLSFTYQPPGFRLGLAISALTLGFAGWTVGRLDRRS
jgi:hypothetical protein